MIRTLLGTVLRLGASRAVWVVTSVRNIDRWHPSGAHMNHGGHRGKVV